MAQATYYCPQCGTAISLSRPLAAGKIIECPICEREFAVPAHRPRDLGYDDRAWPEERQSNFALWLWLSLGFGFLLLMVMCAGIGMVLWYFSGEKSPVAQKSMAPAVPNPSQARAAAAGVVAPTAFPPQTEDYAEARKNFKSKLLQRNPSPQPWDVVEVPPEVTEMEYVSGELRLKAWVDKPAGPGDEKKPAVLFLHGGFAFAEDDWDQAKPFRDAGYVVMMPILRGENGLPGSFSLYYDEVDDVLAAADALAKLPSVDAKRLCVAGHSAGGTLALLAAMSSPRFRAAAAFSGNPDQGRGTDNWNFGFLAPPFDLTDQKELQMRSPLAFPASFKCPVRLYFGGEEAQLKVNCEKLAELAKENNLDVAAVEVPGNHMTAVNPAMKQCIKFFQQH